MNLLLGLPLILCVFVPYRQMTSFAVIHKQLPEIDSKAFSAMISVIIQEKGIIKYATEKYDETQKKASLELIDGDIATLLIMDYAEQLVFNLKYSVSTNKVSACNIVSMKKAKTNTTLKDDFRLFGGSSDTMPHLFTSKHIFKLNSKHPFTYKGTSTVDGIKADHWSTKMEWPEDSDKFTVDYYFTADDWYSSRSSGEKKAFPLRIEVKGKKTLSEGKKKDFHHYYEYLNFQTSDSLSADSFSIPDGATCNYQSDTKIKPVPAISDQIRYTREVIDDKGNVNVAYVVYDKEVGVLKIRSDKNVVYDFKEGVRYSYRLQDRKCDIRAIDPSVDDNVKANGDYIQDIGPSELTLLSKPFVYAGQKITRHLESNSWGGNIDSKPFDVHFAILNWNYPGYNSNSTPPPLSMVRENKQYNFFNFRTSPYRFLWDIALVRCGRSKSQMYLTVKFYTYSRDLSSSKLLTTENRIRFFKSIAKAAGVNPVQVQNAYHGDSGFDQTTRRLHLHILLHGSTQPQYLYRRKDNFAIQDSTVSSSKTAKVSGNSYERVLRKSAQLCEDNASSGKFLCRSFDLCKKSDGSYNLNMYLSLPKSASVSHSSSCNHFARSVDGKAEVSLKKAIKNLKQAAQKGIINVQIDYTNALGLSRNANLTAFEVKYKVFVRRTPRTFYPEYTANTITKTETVDSVSTEHVCEKECLGRTEYDCKAYSFCYASKRCILSDSFPKKSASSSKKSNCPIKRRRYYSYFHNLKGKILASKDLFTVTVKDVNECAMKCFEETKFNCEGFNYCYDSNGCALSKSHGYSLSPGQLKNQNGSSCYHFSKEYVLDFTVSKSTALVSNNPQKLQTISVPDPQKCAYLCRKGYSGQGCVQFEYCSDSKQCRIVSGASQKTMATVDKAKCDTFTLKANLRASVQVQSSSSSYSNGSFAGLAIAMIIIGLALGSLVIYVLFQKGIMHKVVSS